MRMKGISVIKICLVVLLLFGLCAPVYAYPSGWDYRPVYRFFCLRTGEHLYTTDANEEMVLESSPEWRFEGSGWFYSSEWAGEPVYRLRNTRVCDHLYTKDQNEINTLTRNGWQIDAGGHWMFKSNGSIPVYRLFNPRTGRHLLTTDANEYNVLSQRGWRKEGVAFYATYYGDIL